MTLPIVYISLFFLSACFIIFKNNDLTRKIYLILNILASSLLIYQSINILIHNSENVYYLALNEPIGMISLLIDPLSAFFILLIGILSAIVSLYSLSYLKHYFGSDKPVGSHLFMINLFVISMILVVMAQNAIFFLIVWEMMSLTSFLLLNFENEKKEVRSAGLSYFIWMHIAVVCLIFAFLMSSIASNHSFNFNAFRFFLPHAKNLNSIFILFFIGFGIKAGLVPFHSWLIKAHPSAPANISGIMSALMLKMGIYGILRMLDITQINSFSVALFVISISLISALWGIIYAVIQRDIKKILAYSSIENIGIISLGIGIAMMGKYYGYNTVAVLGLGGALFHTLNHSIYKSALFFTSGNIYAYLHDKNIDNLGGLLPYMKHTAAFALIASLSICALPPFNGFISELIIFLSMLKGINGLFPEYSLIFIVSFVLLSCVGVISLIAFTRFYAFIFLGSSRKYSYQEIEPKINMSTFPLLLLTIITLLIILLSGPVSIVLFSISGQIFQMSSINTWMEYSPFIQQIAFYSVSFILLVITLVAIKFLLNRKNKKVYFKTWDCGFQAGNSRMQYTGSSYSVDFYELTRVFFRKKEMSIALSSLFPKSMKCSSLYLDLFDTMIKQKYKKLVQNLIGKFSKIQSGNTQSYLMYGVIFLIILIIYITFAG